MNDPHRHLDAIYNRLPADVPRRVWSSGEKALDDIYDDLDALVNSTRRLDADLRRLVASTLRAVAGDIEP